MDDADQGARGLRAQPGPALLHALREHWGLGRPAGAVDLGGSSSLNLLVDAAEGRYVARVHRPHLTPERLARVELPVLVVLGDQDFAGPADPERSREPRILAGVQQDQEDQHHGQEDLHQFQEEPHRGFILGKAAEGGRLVPRLPMVTRFWRAKVEQDKDD